MPLGGTKDEHFSCFHRSCQLGLRGAFSSQGPRKVASDLPTKKHLCVLPHVLTKFYVVLYRFSLEVKKSSDKIINLT